MRGPFGDTQRGPSPRGASVLKDAIRALRLFNIKADKLRNTRFIHALREKDTGFTLSAGIDRETTVEIRGPDSEAVDAFILTLRFFVSDKEPSSFRRLAETYDSIVGLMDEKEKFEFARQSLNDFLDSRTMFKILDKEITNRHLFEVFIWGELAHANEAYKDIYDRWMQIPILNKMIANEFTRILGKFMSYISYMQQINQDTLSELI